jgi:hypothetical protein
MPICDTVPGFGLLPSTLIEAQVAVRTTITALSALPASV